MGVVEKIMAEALEDVLKGLEMIVKMNCGKLLLSSYGWSIMYVNFPST